MKFSEHYSPFPKQRMFHESRAKYRMFGGAAGPGKTRALLWETIFQAHAFPNVDTLLLRRTFPELEMSLLAEFRKNVPRGLYLNYNAAKHIVTWKNGSTTRFGYCRNENDVYQYQGAEFMFIGLDELTHFTLKQWQFLTSRNRCPVAGSFPCMAAASNPGNIGHAWVKALWVDRVPPPAYERPEHFVADDYAFIRARLDDNPIYANDAEYRKTLESLPETLRRAFLDGDWNIFAGQYFDIFDIGRHTIRAEEYQLQTWWPRWISVDWGFKHPSAVYWHTKTPENRVITYREFVQSELSPRMLGEAIAERTKKDEKIEDVFLSPDAFAHRTAEASIGEQLGDVLVTHGLPRPSVADDDRIGGWMLLYSLLERDAHFIFENCEKLIECIPTLVRDEKHVEDVKKMEGDDPADSWRYGIVSKMRDAPLHKPVGVAVDERIAKIEKDQGKPLDPTSRAIWAQRYEADERRKGTPVVSRRYRGSWSPRR